VGAERRQSSSRLRYVTRRLGAAARLNTSGRTSGDPERLSARLVKQYELLRQREDELRRRSRRLEIALDYMSQGLCMFDAEHRLVTCNARYLQMYNLFL